MSEAIPRARNARRWAVRVVRGARKLGRRGKQVVFAVRHAGA